MDALDEGQNRLVRSLEKLVAILERYDANDVWAKKLQVVTVRIADGAQGSLEQLKSQFGGMGSLNDLILTGKRDGPLTEAEQRDVNRRFLRELDKTYDAMEDTMREVRKL